MTSKSSITVQYCIDATEGTACTTFANTTAGALPGGIYGAFTLTNAGVWNYTLGNTNTATNALAAGATAMDVLRIRADDGTTDTSGATSRYSTTEVVTVTITGANDAPTVVSPAPMPAAGTAGTAYSQPLTGFFTDADDDDTSLTYALVGTCDGFTISGSNLAGSGAGGIIPAATTAGNKTCMVTASDDESPTSATSPAASITVAVTAAANTPPRLTEATTPTPDKSVTEDDNTNNTAGSSFTVADDQQSSITVQYCIDATEGTACTAFANTTAGALPGGIYGAFTLTNAGVWNYTLGNTNTATNALAAGATAMDVLRIRADDGTTDTSGATSRYSTTEVVTVTITGANDAPTADAGMDLAIASGGSYTLDGRGSTDVDGTISTYRWTYPDGVTGETSQPNVLTERAPALAPGAADMTLVYTLRVVDNDGAVSGPDTVTFTVNAPPIPTPTVKGTLPTPDGGTVGMAYRMGLAQFFDNVGSYTTYSVQGATCAGFEVSGANLVGTNSGSIPSSVTTDVPCTIRTTNTGVGTTADAMFTIGITLPTPTVQIVSVTAANSGTGAITVTLSQSGTRAISGVTVNVASTSNPGADYVTAQDYTGNFTDGSNITITISRITDNEPAANANAKTLTVTLTDGSAYNLGTNTSATADLRDSRPYFGVPSSQTIAANADPFNVSVQRYGNNTDAAGSVNVSVTNATGQDAVAVVATSTLNFVANDDEEPVFVSRTSPPPSGSGNGMAVVTVTTGTGYGLASGNVSQTFAITRAAATPTTPTVSISGNNFPSSITEGSSGTITLERSGATTAALQAYVSVASTSFTSNIFGASFATGSPTATVTVNIPADTVSTNETATVTVLTPSDATTADNTLTPAPTTLAAAPP